MLSAQLHYRIGTGKLWLKSGGTHRYQFGLPHRLRRHRRLRRRLDAGKPFFELAFFRAGEASIRTRPGGGLGFAETGRRRAGETAAIR